MRCMHVCVGEQVEDREDRENNEEREETEERENERRGEGEGNTDLLLAMCSLRCLCNCVHLRKTICTIQIQVSSFDIVDSPEKKCIMSAFFSPRSPPSPILLALSLFYLLFLLLLPDLRLL